MAIEHYLLNTIFPIIMFGLSAYFKKHSYVERGSNGYSTPNSRRTQKAWDYAQKNGSGYFLVAAVILSIIIVIIIAISFITNLKDNTCYLCSSISFVICIFGVIFEMEKKLRRINDREFEE